MNIQLNSDDFTHLVNILKELPEFRSIDGRIDLIDFIFAGSPRKSDVLGLLNLNGSPQAVAVRVITRLTQFGQDEPGQETLGVLVNRLLAYFGGGQEADFLRELFARYPLKGVPVSTRKIANWHGQDSPVAIQEKIIGENTLRHVRLLELALEASRAVVHIRLPNSMGTGFLAGTNFIITNNHVVDQEKVAQQCVFTFNYQIDRLGQPASVQTVETIPNGFFYTNPELDFTIIEVEKVPSNIFPLTLSALRVQRNQRVNIIQHPSGHYKKISMQNNFIAFANDHTLQYLTTTEPGSSGSPVFNNEFVVVGIHHSGGYLLEPGTNQTYLRNAGSSMIAILKDLHKNAPQIYAQLKIQ